MSGILKWKTKFTVDIVLASFGVKKNSIIWSMIVVYLLLSGGGAQFVKAGERQNLNGALLRKPDDKNIFWIDQGKRRKILNLKVLLRLFDAENIKAYEDVYLIPEGSTVTGACSLWRCEDGTIIFVDNMVKRVIKNMKAFHRNNFNLSGVKNASCLLLSNMPTGEPIR